MVFKLELNFSFLLKSFLKLSIDLNMGNGALIECDTVEGEFLIKLVNHRTGHVRFEIKDLMKPDSIDKVSHVLFNLCSKKLIKPSSSEFVNKILNHLWISWESESEMDVNIDVSIILGWTSLNWGVIVDDISCEHTGHSSVTAVTPSGSSIHCSNRFTTDFLEHGEICWHIKLDIETTALVGSLDHDDNALVVSVGLTLHLVSCFNEIIC